jgi:hypothetical protein
MSALAEYLSTQPRDYCQRLKLDASDGGRGDPGAPGGVSSDFIAREASITARLANCKTNASQDIKAISDSTVMPKDLFAY